MKTWIMIASLLLIVSQSNAANWHCNARNVLSKPFKATNASRMEAIKKAYLTCFKKTKEPFNYSCQVKKTECYAGALTFHRCIVRNSVGQQWKQQGQNKGCDIAMRACLNSATRVQHPKIKCYIDRKR